MKRSRLPKREMNALEALQAIREADDPAAARAAILEEQRDRTEEIFTQWAEEDANMTPEEIAQAQAEWEEFKRNINAYRAENGEEPVF